MDRDKRENKQTHHSDFQETDFNSILNLISDVEFYLYVENKIILRNNYVSEAFSVTNGAGAKNVIEKKIQEVFSESAQKTVFGKCKKATSGKNTITLEKVSNYPSGKYFAVKAEFAF